MQYPLEEVGFAAPDPDKLQFRVADERAEDPAHLGTDQAEQDDPASEDRLHVTVEHPVIQGIEGTQRGDLLTLGFADGEGFQRLPQVFTLHALPNFLGLAADEDFRDLLLLRIARGRAQPMQGLEQEGEPQRPETAKTTTFTRTMNG